MHSRDELVTIPPMHKGKAYDSKRRAAGLETPHTMWVRNDLWMLLKERKLLTGQKLHEIVNNALFDYLAKNKLEERTGIPTNFDETLFDPDRGTLRKDEAEHYKREDD